MKRTHNRRNLWFLIQVISAALRHRDDAEMGGTGCMDWINLPEERVLLGFPSLIMRLLYNQDITKGMTSVARRPCAGGRRTGCGCAGWRCSGAGSSASASEILFYVDFM